LTGRKDASKTVSIYLALKALEDVCSKALDLTNFFLFQEYGNAE